MPHFVKNILCISPNLAELVQLRLSYEFIYILIYKFHFFTKSNASRPFNPILTGWKKSDFLPGGGRFSPPNYLPNYQSYDNETCTVL